MARNRVEIEPSRGSGVRESAPLTASAPRAGRPSRRARVDAFWDRHLWKVFPVPAAAVLVALIVFPMLYTGYLSLTSWSGSMIAPPRWVGLQNYSELLLHDSRFWGATGRTLLFTLIATAAETVVGLTIALTLHREFRGNGAARTLFMLPMMATPAAIALIWVLMMNPSLGVLDYMLSFLHLRSLWTNGGSTALASLALVDTWEWAPLIGLMCLAGLAALPSEPYEAAEIDGAGAIRTFAYITLPLLRPTIVVALIFRSIDALKTFDIIYVMTQGGPGDASETLNIYLYQSAFHYLQIGYASAIAVLFFVLIVVVSLVLIRLRRVEW